MATKRTPTLKSDDLTPLAQSLHTQAVEASRAFDTAYEDHIATRNHNQEPLYDLEGLMTDFPTARELEQFVFDQTGHVLNLKGRSNKFKYQTAMDVLNGQTPEQYLIGGENPYLDKNDLIQIGRAHV